MNKTLICLTTCLLPLGAAFAGGRTGLPVTLVPLRTAGVMAVGSDNLTRIAWTVEVPNVSQVDGTPTPADYTQNMIQVDTYDTSGNLVVQGPLYGPYGPNSGWGFPQIAVGEEDDVHLGWLNSSLEEYSYWLMDNNNNNTGFEPLSTGYPSPFVVAFYGFGVDYYDTAHFAQWASGSSIESINTDGSTTVLDSNGGSDIGVTFAVDADSSLCNMSVTGNSSYLMTCRGPSFFTDPFTYSAENSFKSIWMTGSPNGDIQTWWVSLNGQSVSIFDSPWSSFPNLVFNSVGTVTMSGGSIQSVSASPIGGDGNLRVLAQDSQGQWWLSVVNPQQGAGSLTSVQLNSF